MLLSLASLVFQALSAFPVTFAPILTIFLLIYPHHHLLQLVVYQWGSLTYPYPRLLSLSDYQQGASGHHG